MSRDKFDAPQCWYKSMTQGYQDEANKSIADENIKINVPCLFFGGTRDFVCRPELMGPAMEAGLVPDLKTVTVRPTMPSSNFSQSLTSSRLIRDTGPCMRSLKSLGRLSLAG